MGVRVYLRTPRLFAIQRETLELINRVEWIRRSERRAVISVRIGRATLASRAAVAATLLATTSFAALAPDLGHVLAILAHRNSTLATSGASFVRRKFMSGSLLMRGTTALAGDLALLVGIHRGKSAIASALAIGVVRHPADLLRHWETKCGTVLHTRNERKMFTQFS